MGSKGMPRASSRTVIQPSRSSVTQICLPYPATASSTALSSASQIRCISPEEEVEPMNMPGRCRMAAIPSSTWMSEAEYVLDFFPLAIVLVSLDALCIGGDSTTSTSGLSPKRESCVPASNSLRAGAAVLAERAIENPLLLSFFLLPQHTSLYSQSQ